MDNKENNYIDDMIDATIQEPETLLSAFAHVLTMDKDSPIEVTNAMAATFATGAVTELAYTAQLIHDAAQSLRDDPNAAQHMVKTLLERSEKWNALTDKLISQDANDPIPEWLVRAHEKRSVDAPITPS